MRRTRSAADRAWSRSSARITPWLPESDNGLTTQGSPIVRVAVATSAPGASSTKRGWGTSASASAWRMAALSRVRATAAGGLCTSPKRSAATAAAITPWSSTPTIAANGVSRARAMIVSAAPCGSDNRSVSARSPITADMVARRSQATVITTPISRAAVMKSAAR